jgi:hypothetical protein
MLSISWLQVPQYPRDRNSSQARRRRRRIHLASRHPERDPSLKEANQERQQTV